MFVNRQDTQALAKTGGAMERILIIDPIHARGGMDHYCIPLAAEMSRLGYHAAIATNREQSEISAADSILYLRFYGDLFISRSKIRNLFWFITGTIRTALWALKNRPIAIHIHFFQYSFLELFLVLMVKLSGKRLVATVHDVESFRFNLGNNALQSVVFRFVNIFIVHNESSRTEILRLFPKRIQDIRVIKHGNYIDVVRQFTRAPQRTCGRKSKLLRVAIVGQIKRVKGLEILLDAMQILKSRGVDYSLNIDGKPVDYSINEIEAMVREYGISDRALLRLTYLSTAEVVASLMSSDVVVLPYRRIYQSGVLLFSMSAGAVVVCSDLPAMREIIKHGENGFIFESGNSIALANVLEQIAAMPSEFLNEISNNALLAARNEFDWRDIAIATIHAYCE